jgi:hypothetical protein
MTRLILVIAVLSIFIFYRASTFRVKRLPTPPKSQSEKSLTKLNTASAAAKAKQRPEPKELAALALPVSSTQGTPPSTKTNNDYDAIADVFKEPDYITEDRLTPEERQAHQANLELIRKIEEENKKNSKPRSWESLTPEEKKSFEIYKKFEPSSEQNDEQK